MHEGGQNPAGALTKFFIVRIKTPGRNKALRESTDRPWLPATLKMKGWAMRTNSMEAQSRKGPDDEGYSHSSFPLKSIGVQKSKYFRETRS